MGITPELREVILRLLPSMSQFYGDMTNIDSNLQYSRDTEEFESITQAGHDWGMLRDFLKGLLDGM